jgi:glycosyltransferase involved in cell wall biosynthesis
MKMFEYMGSGVPIVASDLPVLGEVLTHRRNALIAPAGDVDAWRAAIRELLDEPDLARRLATAARADLERDHTWDRRVATIFQAIAQAMTVT